MRIFDRVDAENLVESQVGGITQADLVTLIRSLRVPARCEQRPWDYGKPGEAYPCWIVLEHQTSNTAVAYCADGFGPPRETLYVSTARPGLYERTESFDGPLEPGEVEALDCPRTVAIFGQTASSGVAYCYNSGSWQHAWISD
jgi:hypothetical protein